MKGRSHFLFVSTNVRRCEAPTLSGLVVPPPVEPEPLADDAGDRVGPPVDKDPQLGLVVPGWTGPAVQAVPGGLVAPHQANQQEAVQARNSSHLSLPVTERTGLLRTISGFSIKTISLSI